MRDGQRSPGAPTVEDGELRRALIALLEIPQDGPTAWFYQREIRKALAGREMCVRCDRLPREFGELCEPCWEIGRDEL